MLWRKGLEELCDWKRRKTTQALLVTGARQVGKTYLIQEFARLNYQHIAQFDLIAQPNVLRALEGIQSADDLFLVLSAFAGEQMVPGKTLIFIDEVQQCKEAITLIKYLVQRQDYDYILSGSLLGVELDDVRSLPVGYLDVMELHPLDFEEFSRANGVGADVWNMIRDNFESATPVLEGVHHRLLDLFHHYLFVGGMPRAVSEFVKTHDAAGLHAIQKNILALYRMDIAKYATGDTLLIKEAFDLMPSQLDSQSKRFALKSLKERGTYDTLSANFVWLTSAGVALAVNNVREPRHPLRLAEDRSYFKLFMNDVGLLSAACGMNVIKSVLSDELGVNYGSIYENAVAQELHAHGFDLFYYRKKGIGELDFVIEREGRVIPLEVKSGKTYKRHSALNNVLATENYKIDQAIVLCEANISVEGRVKYCPVYMVSVITE